jgi:hypothetical protein
MLRRLQLSLQRESHLAGELSANTARSVVSVTSSRAIPQRKKFLWALVSGQRHLANWTLFLNRMKMRIALAAHFEISHH